MNNGWDLGVWWAKSFYAGVLKCGPRPFALAQATRLYSALISSSNKGCELSVTGLHQYSAGQEGSHHTQAHTRIRQTYKKQSSREKARMRRRGGRREEEEGITCPTNRSLGHCSGG